MSIHIKKANRGKFTAYKKRTGKTTAEALHSNDPHVRQMANFARNAKKWKHPYGGEVGDQQLYPKDRAINNVTHPVEEGIMPWKNDPNYGMIDIQDNRTMDAVTGKPLPDTARFHTKVSRDYVSNVVKSAKSHGIDPTTALGINMQETRFDPEYSDNPFNILFKNPDELAKYQGNPLDYTMNMMGDKNKLAKSMGKTSDADVIQAWNGYGKVGGPGSSARKMYGVDTTNEPLDMSKNSVYGKRVVNLRDSVLRKNPEIMKLVNKKYGIGGALQGIGAVGSAIPTPWTQIGGAALSMVGGIIGNQEQENEQAKQARFQQHQQAISDAGIGQEGIINNYMPTFPNGGITPSGVPLEVERGEVMRNPNDGSLAKVSDSAPTHAEGGVDTTAEPGTQIYGKLKVKSGRFQGLTYKEAADKIKKQLARLDKD